MAKIKITRNTVCDKKDVFVDDVVETSETTAKFLISIRKAVEFVEPEKPVKVQKVEKSEKLKKKQVKEVKEE